MCNFKVQDDVCTSSNPHEIVQRSIHLDLDVNFTTQVLSGFAEITAEVKQDGSDTFKLDIRDVAIEKVVNDMNSKLTYVVEEKTAVLGQCLSIHLDGAKKAGDMVNVKIYYATSKSATGLQWLPPSQTAGKMHPYLFTQNQAIHARSMYPCQDTPQAKIKYTAAITVPKPLIALMSASHEGVEDLDNGKRQYKFEQNIAIPTYLVALACGDIVSKDIGPRSKVYSEREMVEAGAYEFAETEEFIKAGEQVCGPYVWGRYDILLLPPSFPYGGMENPVLTFVTSTLLAGDRSQANVVAHEIAHSWTGNLVSTHNWECFWMNEGFTVWVERKILSIIYGEAFRGFHGIVGLQHLKDDVDHLGHDNPLTALLISLGTDVSPDDAFSSVPYEKGSEFLYLLESLIGVEAWAEFFRMYIQKFSYKTVTTEEWKACLMEFLVQKGLLDTVADVNWDAWLNEPGMPPCTTDRDMTMFNAVEKFSSLCLKSDEKDIASVASNGMADEFVTLQWVYCLNKLRESSENVTIALIRALEERFSFSDMSNSEIRFCWQLLLLKMGDEEIFPHVTTFITEQGRMKYVVPLYRALSKCSENGKNLAAKTFKEHRNFYHNTAARKITKELNL